MLLSSPTDIDLEVFTYWVDGKAVDDAFGVYIDDLRKGDAPIGVEFRRKRGNFVMDQSELIKYEIVDQYRTFQSLEHFLCQPSLMQNQSLCIITAALQQSLIDKYWQLDNAFVREVLNRRLTKSRKDLEDISENTGINLRSVTRQFDNIKRVYNAFDEGSNQEEKNIYSFISNVFQLTPALARKYASVVFLLLNKFNMATKRRLRDLPCENLEHCAALVTVFLNLDIRNFYNYLLADGTTGNI